MCEFNMIKRIPVYLLTGFLGSGKTTLLASWLVQPELQDAALIINEIGEVGLDNRLLSSATETRSLIAHACVCCTGLPGLEEALEDLFWARLHRRIPAFSSVVIETTGLADPGPVIASLEGVALLRERYRMAGVITTVDAGAGRDMLHQYAQARAQVANAHLVVITKTDRVLPSTTLELKNEIHRLNPHIRTAESAHASLHAAGALALLMPRPPATPAVTGGVQLSHHHVHDAEAGFLAIPQALEPQALAGLLKRVATQFGPQLLRLKGILQCVDGAYVVVQLAPGDREAQISVMTGVGAQTPHPSRLGLTIIARGAIDVAVLNALTLSLQLAHGALPGR